MRGRNLLQQMLILALVTLFFTGCGGALAGPTSTPTPIPPTPTPTPLPGPKVGRWAGDHSVSFEVTSDDHIRNFNIVVPFTNAGDCTYTLEDIVIKEDDTFLSCEETPEDFIDLFGEEMNCFSGKFDNSTVVSGIYGSSAMVCGGSFLAIQLPGMEEPWNAEWKEP